MTNNLKILTILSIFVFILTGYFYFSSTSVKNQIIVNSNDEKKEIIDINNRDSDKKKEAEKVFPKPLSILFIILSVIYIIIIGIISGVIVYWLFYDFEIFANGFKDEESKKDFKKENFCPTFFVIDPKKLDENEFDNVKEDANYFFEILANFLLPKNEINNNNIKKVKIFLSSNEIEDNFNNIRDDNNKLNDNQTENNENNMDKKNFNHSNPEDINEFRLNLKDILNKICDFAYFSKHLNDDEIDNLIGSLKNNNNNEEIKSKIGDSKIILWAMGETYATDLDNYLCAYLLYYLSETIANKKIEVGVSKPKKGERYTIETKFIYEKKEEEEKKEETVRLNYKINCDIMDKILEKLFTFSRLENITYKKF